MSNELPLISVIITTFKRKKEFLRALESVFNQTYKNIEIIVVDDNAITKEYRKWIQQHLQVYDNIKLILNETNLGGALSRNQGIKASRGEIISFLDDDDIYLPNKIELQYKSFIENNSNNVGLIYCFTMGVTNEGKKLEIYDNAHDGNPLFEHMLGGIAGTSSWLVPKKILEEVGMFEDSPSKQDAILILKILALDYNVHCVKTVLVHYTEENVGKISGIGPKNIEGLLQFRSWSRSFYDKLSSKKINRVEYSFSAQLLTLYILNEYRRQAFEELKNLLKISFFSKNSFIAMIKFFLPQAYKKVYQIYKFNRR